MLDNPDPEPIPDNQDPAPDPKPASGDFNWKSQLTPDYANSPTIKLFPDTKEGFNNAVKSHLELQKLMGHEKIPIPKDANDKAAMDVFKRALKVPEKPEGYGLYDPEIPKNMEGLKFDKKFFSETAHKFNLTPEQAKGLWQTYVDQSKKSYSDMTKEFQDQVSAASQQVRQEWGDAYDSKVQLGQMVVNKFSSDQEMNDLVTSKLVSDPRGIKFLAKIGEQFAENRIGEFKYQRHSLTPDEIEMELSSIRNNPNHPYNNEKAVQSERDAAIKYVNGLIDSKLKLKISA